MTLLAGLVVRLVLQQSHLSYRPPSGIAEFDTEQSAGADFIQALESLSFSPDGRLLASGGSNGTVSFWNMEGKRVRQIVAHAATTKARFSPDGRLLLTWADSREGVVAVKLWTAEGELLDSLSKERVEDAWFSTDGRWILATVEDSPQLAWSLDLDQLLREDCDLLSLYLANPSTVEDRGLCGQGARDERVPPFGVGCVELFGGVS